MMSSTTFNTPGTDSATSGNVNGLSKGSIWTGRILGGLVVLFLVFDATMKMIIPVPSFIAAADVRLGYPVSDTFGIGLALMISTILYVIPRTQFVGAILLTGYLGGAVATQVRVQSTTFETLFPAIFGGLVWFSLFLRNAGVRALVLGRR